MGIIRCRDRGLYLIDGARTANAKPFKGLKTYSPAQMAGAVGKELLSRCRISPEKVDEVILGNAVSAGVGQNFPRHAAARAGLPFTVPAFRVGNVCGSGLQAVINALQSIASGDGALIMAGGTESATRAPGLIFSQTPESVSSLILDGLRCSLTGSLMGELCERFIKKHHLTRAAQDAYALASQEKACAAVQSGNFFSEIIPLPKENGEVFAVDELPRRNMSLEKLAQLPLAFDPAGTITVGNACSPADGAALLLAASQDFCRREKITPAVRVVGYKILALAPEDVFEAGAKAIEQCLFENDLHLSDIDLFEMSEAFAAQMVWTLKETAIPEERMNISGGDIALGHPLGTAGARSLVTLIHALKRRQQKRGLCCVAFGGGGAIAMVVERVKTPFC